MKKINEAQQKARQMHSMGDCIKLVSVYKWWPEACWADFVR